LPCTFYGRGRDREVEGEYAQAEERVWKKRYSSKGLRNY